MKSFLKTTIEKPFCDCPVCKGKDFSYPQDLPHNYSNYQYKFFKFSPEERKELKYSFFEFLRKDQEEVTNILYNLKIEGRYEEIPYFLEKSGIKTKIDNIVMKKRERVKQLREKPNSLGDWGLLSSAEQDELRDLTHKFSYCLDEKFS